MAACRSAANHNAIAGIALKSNILSEVARIYLRCGAGHGGVMFGTAAEAEGHFQPSPSVGDVLRISIFRNTTACRDEFTATNTGTNTAKTVTVVTPCQVIYSHAQPGATPHRHVRHLVTAECERPARGIPEHRHHQLLRHPRHDLRPWPAGKHLAAPVITVGMMLPDPSSTCCSFSVLLSGTS